MQRSEAVRCDRTESAYFVNHRAKHSACARIGQNTHEAITHLSADETCNEEGAPSIEDSDDNAALSFFNNAPHRSAAQGTAPQRSAGHRNAKPNTSQQSEAHMDNAK